MGATKIRSNLLAVTFQKAALYVGCLNILQPVIIFAVELHKSHCLIKEKAYWLGIETVLDIFLCAILIYGAYEEKHFLLVPWISYSAFKCVFGFIDVLLLVYKYHAVQESVTPFPIIYFLQILVTNIGLFFSWIIVVKYYHARRNELLAEHLENSPSTRPIYILSKSEHKPNWVKMDITKRYFYYQGQETKRH